jgi:hypothetical protein
MHSRTMPLSVMHPIAFIPRAPRVMALLALAVSTSACLSTLFPSPSPSPGPSHTPSGSQTVTISPTPSLAPSFTPEPSLSLQLPTIDDPRMVRVSVKAALPANASGQLVITVRNLSTTRISELVLRWPTALKRNVFLAPFAPSQIRIREGGPALYQLWTKWVEGPGELGEPAGTTTLGWGPLDAGATITIPLVANRKATGPVAFDLQLLADEALLTLESGEPAELRVQLP